MGMILLLFLFSMPLIANADLNLYPEVLGAKSFVRSPDAKERLETASYQVLFGITASDRSSSLYAYEVDMALAKRSDGVEKASLYLGKDLWVSGFFKYAEVYAGRKSFKNKTLPTGIHDGSEGIGLINKSGNFQFRFDLYDHYRGYPLREDSIIKTPEPENNKNRSRHSLFLDYNNEKWSGGGSLKYLRLGNWGEYSGDDFTRREKGDGDFIYVVNMWIGVELDKLKISAYLNSSRGLDKNTQSVGRPEKSIPHSGESIGWNIGYQLPNFKFVWDVFIPDSDKRDQNNTLLEYGYTGTGSIGEYGFITSQILDFYPSAWVTQSGFDKKNTYMGGRTQALRWHNSLEFTHGQMRFALGYHYILPTLMNGHADGRISLKKDHYEKIYFQEAFFRFNYSDRKTERFFFSIQTGVIQSSKSLKTEGSYLYFSAGLRL